MKDPGQFGSPRPTAEDSPPGRFDCSAVELWLAESAENILPSASAEAVSAHAQKCEACRERLEQARRGREWLLVLKQESLTPPADLVAKILARTSHAGAPGTGEVAASAPERQARIVPEVSANHDHLNPWPNRSPVVFDDATADRGAVRRVHDHPLSATAAGSGVSGYPLAQNPGPSDSSVPVWQRSSVVVLRRTLLEPRLALVAAMAFFSISLTLNLMGIKLTSLRAADLAPRNMHRAVVRQYADANARVARYYENLRIVYEVEARVQQLRRAAATTPPSNQESKPGKNSSHSDRSPNENSNGNLSSGPNQSRHERMAAAPGTAPTHRQHPATKLPDPPPTVTGPRMDVSFHPELFHPEPQQRSNAFPTPANSGWLEQAAGDTLATSFAIPLGTLLPLPEGFKLAPPASSCPLRTICFARRDRSAPERRLA